MKNKALLFFFTKSLFRQFGFYLYFCLELQQLNDEIFRYEPAKVLLPKQQRVINVTFSLWRCQDQLVCPKEGGKVGVVEVFFLTGPAVGSRPELNWVSSELDRLEASRENYHNNSHDQENLERK